MKIALLLSAFNSLSQAVFVTLKDMGHSVGVVYAINDEQIERELREFSPQLVLAPFLKRYISPKIFEKWPIYLFHPGPRGDRGPDSLEHALSRHEKRWGGVWLKVAKELDSGDIYAQSHFEVRECTKASLYREEVTHAAVSVLPKLFENIINGKSVPQKMEPMHRRFKEEDRKIDWQRDSTKKIIEKIYLSDSHPGVLDEIAGIKCYLYGAHEEQELPKEFTGAKPKSVIAKRDGAVCLKTLDGALWVSHLKEPGKFKLPATYVLKSAIKGVKERRIALVFDRSYTTFYEIWAQEEGDVTYLHFNFHNGAMSSDQCIRLKYAIEYLKQKCRVLVLMGGEEFFSNGIHLNILEDSQKQGEDGWSNINAMNDLVHTILTATECVTVASFGKNAGAGGLFLGIACDIAVARDGVVLNPHYKTLGLSGSEYHTYTLFKRVDEDRAKKLLEDLLPISANYAKKIGLIDKVLPREGYENSLKEFCKNLAEDLDAYYDILDGKEQRVEEDEAFMQQCVQRELERMHPQFWDPKSEFHKLRREFVYKICPTQTPKRFQTLNRMENA